jgi:hypothetical protein
MTLPLFPVLSISHLCIALFALIPIFFLYAEMHFRLPFFKGWLYQQEPEILFDLPYRIQGDTIPVLLLVKDADQFPIQIQQVEIRILSPIDHQSLSTFIDNETYFLEQKWFSRIFELDATPFKNESILIDCLVRINIKNKTKTIRNDNYRTLSQAPFRTFIDSEPLPGLNGWLWGDLHCHSSFTEDQVEFGMPPERIRPLAQAMGLSFCALTEHSYDMDDYPGSWTKNDPNLAKWHDFQSIIQQLNQNHPDFLILPGEEVSADNGFGQTVHLAVVNDPQFYPGTGDGMEAKLGHMTEHHYAKVLSEVSPNTLVFAAHPVAHQPFSHRLLLRRGMWNRWDLQPALHGYQIIAGSNDKNELSGGKSLWIHQLLRGQKQYIYAGNDAHGNFNRFRQIKIPMLKMHEHANQIFGYNLTGVKATLPMQPDKLIAKLKSGSVFTSNGPFLNIYLEHRNMMSLIAKSSNFFGSLQKITLIAGDLNQQKEIIYKIINCQSGEYSIALRLELIDIPTAGYIRAELTTRKDKFALTNPVWFCEKTVN